MHIVVISGRSGSGKSTGLHLLEDEGYYCIDNLPVSLLPDLVTALSEIELQGHAGVAVCIDARNSQSELNRFKALLEQTRQRAKVTVVFLDADDAILQKRFSETKRRHPLSGDRLSLKEALIHERERLEPIYHRANLSLDTSALNLYQLRDALRERLIGKTSQSFSLLVESFGFKHGVPLDADYIFDLRMLPNPHWEDALRKLTGKDPGVQQFLENSDDYREMYSDIYSFLIKWLPKIAESNRSYVTIAIGCTGGQHRSVYMAEKLATALRQTYDDLQLRHRELG